MERPTFWGINHIKLAAADIRETQAFYTGAMGMEHIPAYDHRKPGGELFAAMVKHRHASDSEMLVEIRHNEDQARKQQRWDPVTYGVRTRADLELWRKWFEQNGVECSRVFTGLKAWVLAALDPDGKFVRLCCDEEHEWTTDFDHDDFWLP